MTETEVLNVLRIIKFTYPNFRVSDEDARDVLNLWHQNLADVPAELVQHNLKRHIANERFAPTISELREGYSAYGERMKRLARQYMDEHDTVPGTVAVPPPAMWYELKQKLAERHE